jgi:hypothetical protein
MTFPAPFRRVVQVEREQEIAAASREFRRQRGFFRVGDLAMRRTPHQSDGAAGTVVALSLA